MATHTPVPDHVRALSIRPPWSEWLVAGIKPIENRTWRTHWRGTLAIHASTTIDYEGFAYGAARGHQLDVLDVAHNVGEFIGAVDLVDVHRAGSDRCDQRCTAWGDPNCWHWVCTNARRITSIEARGPTTPFRASGRRARAAGGDRVNHVSATTAYVQASRRSRRRSITVTFHYDPSDPFAVTLLIQHRGRVVKWVFARELLADGRLGIEGPGGDVTVSPAADPRQVLIDLCSPHGHSVLWVEDKDVLEFLTATYELVPAGTETDRINWARELPILRGHWWLR